VPDGGARHVEGAGGLAGRGAFGEVGAEREWIPRQGEQAAGVAPALPLAPDQGVEVAGRLGAGGADRLVIR
jgi:hypothetical protein